MFRFTYRHLALLLGLSTAACGQVDYKGTKAGDFEGSLFVMWVGEGGALGDGKFVFVPNPAAPLTFTTVDSAGRAQVIRPEMMYTDGGSIPKIGQVFNGFGPWGYAPAYMVHDWLFVARQCNRDGTPTAEEQKIAGMSFQDSATIMASAINSLVQAGRVQRNDIAGSTISSVVAGPIARSMWDKKGVCQLSRVSEADRLAAEAAIPGSSGRSALRRGGVTPATVIGAFSF